MMNDWQRLVLALGLAVVVLMGLYPPWIEVWDQRRSGDSSGIFMATPIGYAPVWRPPPKQESNEQLRPKKYVAIDFHRLALQEGVVVAAIVGGIVLSKDRGGSKPMKISAGQRG